MTYVGIDISKYKHDCFIQNSLGEVLHTGFSFTNDLVGFAVLEQELACFDKEDLRIGFEATGHYTQNLMAFLECKGYTFMELQPSLVAKYIAGKTLRRTKTDKLDARMIAGYMDTVAYRPYPQGAQRLYALKSLTRFRLGLVRRRSEYMVLLTNVLDRAFPEFKPFFGNKFSVTAFYILANYPSPQHIANMNSRSFDVLRRKSRGKFSMDKFVKLKALAKNTVGNWNEELALEWQMLLELYSELDAKIDEIEAEITRIIVDMDPPTLSIKGIGPLSAAVIVSEFGDFSRFSNPNKMLKFAGLEPGYFQSGTWEHKGHMVKRGSSPLRAALMNLCNPMLLHNEVFATYYYKKTSEGKPYRVAQSHMVKKLIRLIWTLETRGEKFNPELQH